MKESDKSYLMYSEIFCSAFKTSFYQYDVRGWLNLNYRSHLLIM